MSIETAKTADRQTSQLDDLSIVPVEWLSEDHSREVISFDKPAEVEHWARRQSREHRSLERGR